MTTRSREKQLPTNQEWFGRRFEIAAPALFQRLGTITNGPVIDIIDAKGVIQARNLSQVEAPAAVDALMKD